MSTANSFSLLDGDDGWTLSTKSKKKSKKKGSSGAEQATQAEVPSVKDANVEDGAAAGGFQVVKRNKTPPKGNGSVVNGHSNAMDGPALEKAAMTISSGAARTLLLKEWQAKIQSDQAFRTEIVRSQAVERLVEGMAAVSSPEDDALPLSALLSSIAHPSSPPALPHAVADLIVICGSLSPQDPLAPKPQAVAAGSAAVAVVKQGIPQVAAKSGSTSSVGGIAALEALQTRLESLEAAFERAVTIKDQSRVATQLFEASRDGADLGNPDSGASAFPAAAAALSALESLRSALTARHKVLTAQGGAGSSVEEQTAAAQRAHSREDATLATKETEADALVADLEQKLAAARATAQEIKARRAAAKQLLQQTVDGLSRGAAANAANSARIASTLETAIQHAGKVDTALHAAVKSVSASATKELSKKWIESGLAEKFTAATIQHLESSIKYMKELGSKAAFYRERLDASTRQGEQLAMLKDTQALAEHKKQRKSLENLLADALAAAVAEERATQATVEAWRARQDRLRKQGGAAAIPAGTAQKIDTLAAEATQLGEDIASGKFIQTALPSKKAQAPRAGAGSASEMSGRTTPGSSSVALTAASGDDLISTSSELAVLEQRLAALEKENKKKDAQIAAMMAAASVEIPSPAPMSLKKK